MNWTEKYRPITTTEIIGQDRFVDDAQTWIATNVMPNLLLYGMAGTGKTSAAHTIANDILEDHKDSSFKEINASQDRRLETIRETISKFASTKQSEHVPFKICLIDEMDGMTKDAQRALKRTMERALNVRFIITCNDMDDVIYPIRSRCANYWFRSLDSETIITYVKDILQRENILHPGLVLVNFINSSNGDLRLILNTLQACRASDQSLENIIEQNMNEYIEIYNNLSEGQHQAHSRLLNLVYQGQSIRDIASNLHQCAMENDEVNFKFLATLGEMEWRSKTMTPKIIVSWFTAQFMKNE